MRRFLSTCVLGCLTAILAMAPAGIGQASEQASEQATEQATEQPTEQATEQPTAKQPTVVEDSLGSTNNVHRFGDVWLAGQPSPDDLQLAKQRGIQNVITLRQTEETTWDEAAAVEDLGLQFDRVSMSSLRSMTDEVMDEAIATVDRRVNQPTLLHCGSATRVSAIWLAHRVLNDGIPLEDARQEAKTIGLSSGPLEDHVLGYIKRRQ